MIKTLGYGYKLADESIQEALNNYGPIDAGDHGFHTTKKDAIKAIKYDKKEGIIPASAKPQVFRVTVEVL